MTRPLLLKRCLWAAPFFLLLLGCDRGVPAGRTETAGPQGANAVVGGGGTGPCSFPTPEGWVDLSGGTKTSAEAERPEAAIRSSVTLRELGPGLLDTAVEAARDRVEHSLGSLPDFELTRNEDLARRGVEMPAHLLAWRYRSAQDKPVLQHYEAVYQVGGRVVGLSADSEAVIIDSLQLPHKEAGRWESRIMRSIISVRCR
jgi:hypothetical protein